ncbi:hypothetical protein [Fischerella thermalis]|uniref:hypothetical protein n=1 Tax=Fischerella thermalis TaxID=372787 RepID=UPI0003073C49|nr:hypothetical protein [Fischerella thermalis]
MAIKPWYKIDGLTPREDLREGKPLDASEFAVHLDKVRDKTAPAYYQDPEQFFNRTYITKYLTEFSAQVVRRLSGEKTETSAVFNLSTQFGGGKTHALTLLYHLAKGGPTANNWTGVLLNGDAVKDAIARGVKDGTLAYVGKSSNGYEPFHYQCTFNAADVEISEDMFIITQETAEAYQKALAASVAVPQAWQVGAYTQANTNSGSTPITNTVGENPTSYVSNNINQLKDELEPTDEPETITPVPSPQLLRWSGAITPQKWMNFYTKVLTKFATNKNLKLALKVEFLVEGKITQQTVEETKVALAELGLNNDVETDIHEDP